MITYLPAYLKQKYNNKVIGYIRYKRDKYFLIAEEKHQPKIPYISVMFIHLAQITLRCEKCARIISRVAMPKLVFLVDRIGVRIELNKIDPDAIWSLHHCGKCEHKILSRVSAPVLCNRCGRVITWLYPQKNEAFEIKVGKEYHVEICNNCNPLIKNELIEFKEALSVITN